MTTSVWPANENFILFLLFKINTFEINCKCYIYGSMQQNNKLKGKRWYLLFYIMQLNSPEVQYKKYYSTYLLFIKVINNHAEYAIIISLLLTSRYFNLIWLEEFCSQLYSIENTKKSSMTRQIQYFQLFCFWNVSKNVAQICCSLTFSSPLYIFPPIFLFSPLLSPPQWCLFTEQLNNAQIRLTL